MARRVEDVVDRALLDDAARVHHDDPVGVAGHDAEVVGDEEEGELELGARSVEQLEDLRLRGHVERGGGLVGDEHARTVGQRHREQHPLPHAARELMRVVAGAPVGAGDPDLLEQLDRPPHRRRTPDRRIVHGDRLGHLRADADAPG